MTSVLPETVYVQWQDLLDVYQGPPSEDEQMKAWFATESGQVTCKLFLGMEFNDLLTSGRILEMPVKSPKEHLQQRQRFAESCCEPQLRESLQHALRSKTPFVTFDAVLKAVPIEATRWREEQREQDQLALERWLARAGIRADPPAVIKRTVIEFPRKIEPNQDRA